MNATNNNALANGFTPLTEPATSMIADGILIAIHGLVDATRWIAKRLSPVMAEGTIAPHAAVVMEPARFILGR